jgi:phosphopantothenoylcysteine decarboxylase/phosphopantothenoylcysteine decarboxylase/phosphopantothenate--cysteine ligase
MKDKGDILIAVSASIAAYRTCELVRSLVKKEYPVRVIMTPNATHFIGKIVFEALTGRPVLVDEYESGMPHIESKNGARVFALVPGTANTIAKFASGLADDLVGSTYLALSCPVIIAPAMNPGMWNHPATQRNIEILRKDGAEILSPQSGVVICGDEGQGKLAELSVIEEAIIRAYDRK